MPWGAGYCWGLAGRFGRGLEKAARIACGGAGAEAARGCGVGAGAEARAAGADFADAKCGAFRRFCYICMGGRPVRSRRRECSGAFCVAG